MYVVNTVEIGCTETFNIPCIPSSCSIPCLNTDVPQLKKDEPTMYINAEMTKEQTAQIYLRDRLENVHSEKRDELRHQFGLCDDDPPCSFEDAYKRITEGKFIIADDKRSKLSYNPLNFVQWRDPSVKKDTEGFEAAEVQAETAFTQVSDAIMVKTPQEALTALEEYENATFH